jgi:hypothetical protein
MSYRVAEHYLNVDTMQWCASNGSPLVPRSIFSTCVDKILLRLHLIHGDGSVYTGIDAAYTFRAIIATLASTAGVTVVSSANTEFNIDGDWDESETVPGVNVAEGRICVRLDCATVEMVQELGTKVLERFWFTLSLIVGTPVAHFVLPVVCKNANTSSLSPLPITTTIVGVVSVPQDSYSVTVEVSVATGTPVCTLLAPVGDLNNITIANVQCATDKTSFTVLLSSPVPTTGFRISYLVVPV